jgi:hypothetical protein
MVCGMGAYLDEPDILALLTEALTADVQAVLADETGLMGADAAIYHSQFYFLLVHFLHFGIESLSRG